MLFYNGLARQDDTVASLKPLQSIFFLKRKVKVYVK
jgi:hypothetical protein